MNRKPLALFAAMSFAFASAAFAAPPTKQGTTSKGAVLTDEKGMTLYTFDKDSEASPPATAPARPTGQY